MRILALDSSGLVASVAVVEDGAVDDQVIAEYTVNYKKTHSQTLLPMLDEIVKMTELDLHTVDAIAVAGGPGSQFFYRNCHLVFQYVKLLSVKFIDSRIHLPASCIHDRTYNICDSAQIVSKSLQCRNMDQRFLKRKSKSLGRCGTDTKSRK